MKQKDGSNKEQQSDTVPMPPANPLAMPPPPEIAVPRLTTQDAPAAP